MPIIVDGSGGGSIAAGQPRWWIRQAISRHIDERNLITARATSAGAAGTTISSDLVGYPDDHWKGGEITPYEGTVENLGLGRFISAFDSSTGTITHAPLPAPVQSQDAFELRRHGPFVEAINQTINEAILAVYDWAYVPVDDETLLKEDNKTSYVLPDHFVLVSDVLYPLNADQTQWKAHPLRDWSVELGSMPKLVLSENALGRYEAGQKIRLLGYRQPNLLTSDTDVSEVNPTYIIAYALGQLLGNMAGGPTTDPDAHFQRQQFWTAKANVERQLALTKISGTARRVRR